MRTGLSRFVSLAVVAFGVVCAPLASLAADYPERPIKLIVPYPPGGTADVMARLVAAGAKSLSQSIIVENKGGAGGNIAAETVARAAPDGYTLIMGNAPILAINPSLYKKISFDPVKDFAPITPIAEVPLFLVVTASSPYKSVDDILAAAKKSPGGVNYASGSVGSTTHLAMELFKSMAHVDLVHIPFKGSGPALTALVAGQVQIMFELMPSATPFVKSGQLRALAVTSSKRSENFPQLPTIAEQPGLDGFQVSSWFGVLAPAGTPKPIVDKLNAAFTKEATAPDFKARLEQLGAVPMSGGPREFEELIKQELVKWAAVVKASGARVE
jgi:tripartite-type tricarboxylate transporter receptor subunit TctC